MKYENEIFKILCTLSFIIFIFFFCINKCKGQTFVDLEQKNNYTITYNKTIKIK